MRLASGSASIVCSHHDFLPGFQAESYADGNFGKSVEFMSESQLFSSKRDIHHAYMDASNR